MTNESIDLEYQEFEKALIEELGGSRKLVVVQAPPGSGKTHTLIAVVAALVKNGKSVALAAQTNRQADDIAIRWSKEYGNLPATRLGSSSSVPPNNFPSNVIWETKARELPRTPGIYISTSAKWTTLREPDPFDLLAVDEAWQMSWADLMQCANLSAKYYLIGDPGQIPPVVTIDVRRWETAPRPPHKPAPEVVMSDPDLVNIAFVGSLPACKRLPYESVEFIKPFYAFDFEAYAKPGERVITFKKEVSNESLNELTDKLKTGAPMIATLTTPNDGPSLEVDTELANSIKEIVLTLLNRETSFIKDDKGKKQKLKIEDIGVSATHRAMNGEIRRVLGADLNQVSIDTPERWQGLQRPFMIVVHPLSSSIDPSDFDLETGRLCVMTSRHQSGLIVITRDHVGKTLAALIPEAAQAPGKPDIVGRGHAAHSKFWEELEKANRVLPITF